MMDRDALESLLGEYFARSGREGAEAFIRQHPEHAEVLEQHLAFLDVVDGAFSEPAIPDHLGIYRIEEEVGSGGMGTVYRAVSEKDGHAGPEGTTVALKLMHPHLFRSSGFFKRFLREADLGGRIDHPNVVRTFDVDAVEEEGQLQHFLVMEYVEGQTLREMLNELDRAPEELARQLGREICQALSAIHAKGAVHRDLKPENVLITPDQQVKVMDLGVARLVDEQVRLSQTGAFVGSLQYAAPEQFQGGKDLDGRADLHGLGLLLYELCCGENPYAHEDVHVAMRRILTEEPRKLGERNPQLSPFFEEVVHHLLAKDPERRFASADVLLGVLEEGEASPWWRERAQQLRHETKRPLRRIRVPRETAVYGREAELAKLQTLFEAAKEGDGRVVLVDGEAGIGKTRLVDEFVARLERAGEDLDFLFASYPPGGAATASGAFSTAYREHLEGGDLEVQLQELLPQTPILVPAFAALLRGDSVPEGVERLTKDSLQTCFVHLTRSLAARRPTVVLIDDLHFAPEEGRALFTALALAAPGHSILLVGTTRPGLPEDWVANLLRHKHASSLSVPRLSPKDLVTLLGDSFKSDRLAEELAGKIAVKSDGNPFFVFEILEGLREGQFISQRPDGSWHTTRLIEDIMVPSSIFDLVNARVADLSEEDRTLLDVAACWGYEFDPTLVGDVLGLGRIPVLRAMAQVERAHRLVRAHGRHYVFDHHQVKEALYGSLSEPLREEYHAALAGALERRHVAADADAATLDGALSVDLCEHFLRGVQGDKALRYLDGALTHLESGFLSDRAVALADAALSSPGLLEGKGRLDVLVRLARHLGILGRRVRQEEVIGESRRIAEACGGPAEIQKAEALLGILCYETGRLDEAERSFKRCLEFAQGGEHRKAEANFNAGLGGVHLSRGRIESARRYFERSLEIAVDIRDSEEQARALQGLANLSFLRGSCEKAYAQVCRSLEMFRDAGNHRAQLHACQSLALILGSLGRHEEAREVGKSYLTLALKIGDRLCEARGRGLVGVTLAREGRRAEAIAQFERTLSLARETDDVESEALALLNLGTWHQEVGHWRRSRSALEAALALCNEHALRFLEGSTQLQLALLADEAGDLPLAVDLTQQALSVCRDHGYQEGMTASLIKLGELRTRAGDSGTAREALEEAHALAREGNLRSSLSAEAELRLVSLSGGVADVAPTVLAAVDGNYESVPLHYLIWTQTGDREHLAEAKRLVTERIERSPPEDRDAMWMKVRLHREIESAWKALHPE